MKLYNLCALVGLFLCLEAAETDAAAVKQAAAANQTATVKPMAAPMAAENPTLANQTTVSQAEPGIRLSGMSIPKEYLYCKLEDNVKYYGYDYKKFIVQKDWECQETCINEYPKCKGFTFVKSQSRCYLKTQMDRRTPNSPDDHSGICKVKFPVHCKLQDNVKYFGYDYKKFIVQKVWACQETCINEYPKCKGFTFVKSQKRCYLKSRMDRPYPYEPNDHSGICEAKAPVYCQLEDNVKYYGYDYRKFIVQKVWECQDTCINEYPKCKGFTFVKSQKRCYLKSQMDRRTPNEPNDNSGICKALSSESKAISQATKNSKKTKRI